MSLLHFKVSKEVENYTTHTKIDLDFFKTKVMFFVTFFFGKKYKQTNIQANKRHLRIKKKYKDPPPKKKKPNKQTKQLFYYNW